MITHLKFMSIPVFDQDRALKFYTEKLGFKVATDQEMGPGRRWIELRLGKAESRLPSANSCGDVGDLWPSKRNDHDPFGAISATRQATINCGGRVLEARLHVDAAQTNRHSCAVATALSGDVDGD